MNRHTVLIARRWHDPNIAVSVTDEDMRIVMTLQDFVRALSIELGQDVSRSAERVVAGMKQAAVRGL